MINIHESYKTVTHKDVAQLIADRTTVAIFQGQSEAGPRALGNRSILYDPRDPDGKKRVNQIKKREWYRPFAASVLQEHADEWFNLLGEKEYPYMMYVVEVREHKRELIPCVTHVDGTCRIQTVTEKQNPHFYKLIKEFYKITKVPMLFNTSLNLAGEVMPDRQFRAEDIAERGMIDRLYLPEKQQMFIPNWYIDKMKEGIK